MPPTARGARLPAPVSDPPDEVPEVLKRARGSEAAANLNRRRRALPERGRIRGERRTVAATVARDTVDNRELLEESGLHVKPCPISITSASSIWWAPRAGRRRFPRPLSRGQESSAPGARS